MKTVIARTCTWSWPIRPAYSVTADDGKQYYVKPITTKDCIVKKVLGSRIAAFCGVKSVETAQVVFDNEFVGNSLAKCNTQAESQAPTPGVHFGSLYPADPATTAVYDMLPANLAESSTRSWVGVDFGDVCTNTL